jgi:hypothetical protein
MKLSVPLLLFACLGDSTGVWFAAVGGLLL